MPLTGNNLGGNQVLIADFLMDGEATGGLPLQDSSSNMYAAALTGLSFPNIIDGYENGGLGSGNGRAFGLSGAISAYIAPIQTLAGTTTHLMLEVLVKLQSLPSSQLEVAALLDAGGNNVFGIAIDTTGHPLAHAKGSASGTVTAISPTAFFPGGNWVHLVARYNFSTLAVDISVKSPPGQLPVAQATTTLGSTLTNATQASIHQSLLPVDGIDRYRLTASTITFPSLQVYKVGNFGPGLGTVLAGTGLILYPRSSAGCIAVINVKPQQAVDSNQQPLSYAPGDALNPDNWVASAADGTPTRVAIVTPAGEPNPITGYQFDLTFEQSLSVGALYTVREQNLTALGDPVIPDGSQIESILGTFKAIPNALAAKTPAQMLYSSDLANPPSVGDYTVDSSGDFGIVNGLDALKKRIFRRLQTPPNGFSPLPGYGIGVPGFIKQTQTMENKRKLLNRIQQQLTQEPGVLGVAVTYLPLPGGLVRLNLGVRTKAGNLSLSYLQRQ